VDFLEEQSHLQIFFAPGPRITTITPNLMERILALSPILHLNETEARSFTQCPVLEEAIIALHNKTGNDLIVTQGDQGASCFYQGKPYHIGGHKAKVIDTIGAGDAHIGSIIASLHQGKTLPQALAIANVVSAAVVSVAGAGLTQEEYNRAIHSIC